MTEYMSLPQAPGAVLTWTGTDATLVANDWLAFVNYSENAPAPKTDRVGTLRGSAAEGSHWAGTHSYEEALRLAREGSPADAAKLNDAVTAIKAREVRDSVPVRRYDVAGERPDIARACGGDPASMVTRKRSARRTAPVVRILVHLGALADVTGAQKTNRGAAILTLVDQLENNGQRVELTGVTCASQWGDGTWTTRVTLKQADEPLNLDVLAFALVNPATQRFLDFACRCSHPTVNFSGMGSSRSVTPEAGVIYFDVIRSSSTWNSPLTAAATIQAEYEIALGRFAA